MADNFDVAADPVPTAVKQVTLRFVVTDTGAGNDYSGHYRFEILDQNDNVIDNRAGNLVPHLTAGQQSAIVSFLDDMLTKAQGVIP